MSTPLASPGAVSAPYGEEEIRRRLDACPKLASLHSVNSALSRLVKAEDFETSQIAQVIRHDPSLSARLLRMVNSVYFGLSARINNIDEAVFFLGLRRIRELSMATPVIEELERLQSVNIPSRLWKELWSHSIATATLCREILASAPIAIDDDTDYLVGLLHNVGKIVMAYAFPEELMATAAAHLSTPAEICILERELIGWDHAQIGAYFLERHQLSDEIVFAVRYHHDPERAPSHQQFAAAVQVSDYLARHAGLTGGFEHVDEIAQDTWTELGGWKILYGADERDAERARQAVPAALQRLPTVLKGLL
jgi:HD-like signal output (HDOD) protein